MGDCGPQPRQERGASEPPKPDGAALEQRRTEERLAGLLTAAPDAIVTVDRAGQIVLANAQAEALFGCGPGELLGTSVDLLVPGASRAAHRRLREGYAAAPRVRPMGAGLELAGLRRDGTEFPVEIRLSPLSTDEGVLVTAIIRDVSDRKAAEARQRLLAETGALLARSLDDATTLQQVARLAIPLLADFVAVDLLDEAGVIRRAAMAHRQPTQEALVQEMVRRFPLALQRETLVTRAIRQGAPDFVPELGDDLLRALAQDEEHLRLWRALGLRSLLVAPLIARGQTLGGIVLAYGDSGRRYAAADQPFAVELALRAALAIDNARLYRQAQEAIRARDAFFAAVSHDLRNPLAAIKMIAQTMLYQTRQPAPVRLDQWERGVIQIDRAADRTDALVGQLLDVARLQAGRTLELQSRPTDLVALARQTAEDEQRLAVRHQIRVVAEQEHLVGVWDRRRLERVVANLIDNAVKYSPAGGPVTVDVAADGRWASLQVQDQGLGIPAQDMPRVFERFHRAANVIGKIGGTGVGLASSRQIVEQHGGTIAVESEEGRGTRITVRLPLADPAEELLDRSED
jgi:PAS domain S-box-containing protein